MVLLFHFNLLGTFVDNDVSHIVASNFANFSFLCFPPSPPSSKSCALFTPFSHIATGILTLE